MAGSARTRKEKADETRARVFASAVDLFRKDGFHGTTIDEIAARAGVAKGTFFVHFRSKEAVIAELVRIQTSAAIDARARAIAAGADPIRALRTTVLTLAEMAAASRSLSRGVLSATLESREVGGEASDLFETVFAAMTADAREAKKKKMLLAHADPDALAASLMACYLGGVLHFASTKKAISLVELVTPLVDANLRGAVRSQTKTISKRGKK
ncbi:MAG: TetR/AcrR family transcriptional regulator [Polyangiaceae bacterium]